MTKAVAKNKYAGHTKGQMEQRERILQMLEEEIQRFEKHPYKLGSFDTHGIYLGLKIAHLHVKEMKWT